MNESAIENMQGGLRNRDDSVVDPGNRFHPIDLIEP
jgi:hypothetical protein